jgi:hypothetical protein
MQTYPPPKAAPGPPKYVGPMNNYWTDKHLPSALKTTTNRQQQFGKAKE